MPNAQFDLNAISETLPYGWAYFDQPDVNSLYDLISIDAAVLEYGISRSTIFRLIKEGLARYRRQGDRKTYVSRSQLEEMTAFRRVD
ncbi:MAG: hypothetical protein IT301_05190 [Dehalococcoidia bacterium]|nr:hypothetical protein [Dehalococcoidia bacterium]